MSKMNPGVEALPSGNPTRTNSTGLAKGYNAGADALPSGNPAQTNKQPSGGGFKT